MLVNVTVTQTISPSTMGLVPTASILRRSVFNPIALSAITIRNLPASVRKTTTGPARIPDVFNADIARNPSMNHGKMPEIRT